MLCQKVISGGQTGVDRGALDAALEKEFPCGGWCPAGRKAEDGIIDKKYPLQDLPVGSYADRTKKNVQNSDGSLIIYNKELSGGTLLTYQVATELNKPVFLLKSLPDKNDAYIPKIIKWISECRIGVLNIAGPRASEWKEGYKISKQITSLLIVHLNY